ncbi:MAG: response regulator [Gemmataceae bacterium]|nr:response regulator [Gemmataceae bacterium]MCI0738811.1 response regulator [Gemmataceae bacterium]
MSKNKFNVCIIDDDNAIRTAFKNLLKATQYNVAAYGSGQEFLAAFDPKNVAALVVDLRMPGMNGLELLEILKQRKVYVPVIILTGHGDIPITVQAIKAGAFDVIEKPLNQDTVLDRLARAVDVWTEWHRVEGERKEVAARIADLTPRELEVLDLMVGGRTNKMIAEHLGISRKTLDIHRSKVMAKMKARTVADLVRWRMLDLSGPGGATWVKASEFRP